MLSDRSGRFVHDRPAFLVEGRRTYHGRGIRCCVQIDEALGFQLMTREQLLIDAHICPIEGIRCLVPHLKCADIIASNSTACTYSGKISCAILLQKLADFITLLTVHIE